VQKISIKFNFPEFAIVYLSRDITLVSELYGQKIYIRIMYVSTYARIPCNKFATEATVSQDAAFSVTVFLSKSKKSCSDSRRNSFLVRH
jgi:hypothetical protein